MDNNQSVINQHYLIRTNFQQFGTSFVWFHSASFMLHVSTTKAFRRSQCNWFHLQSVSVLIQIVLWTVCLFKTKPSEQQHLPASGHQSTCPSTFQRSLKALNPIPLASHPNRMYALRKLCDQNCHCCFWFQNGDLRQLTVS